MKLVITDPSGGMRVWSGKGADSRPKYTPPWRNAVLRNGTEIAGFKVCATVSGAEGTLIGEYVDDCLKLRRTVTKGTMSGVYTSKSHCCACHVVICHMWKDVLAPV